MLDRRTSPEHRDLPQADRPEAGGPRDLPRIGVDVLPDLRGRRQLHHRGAVDARDDIERPEDVHRDGAEPGLSWDITYLASPVRGRSTTSTWSGHLEPEDRGLGRARRGVDGACRLSCIRRSVRARQIGSEDARAALGQRRPDEGLDDARDAAASGHRAVLQPPARQTTTPTRSRCSGRSSTGRSIRAADSRSWRPPVIGSTPSSPGTTSSLRQRRSAS